MTATPPPAEDAQSATAASMPPDQSLPPASQETGQAGSAGAVSSVARATALTEELIDRGAPWSPRTSWVIVAVEGVVAVILGLLILFEPLGGSSTTLQLVGLVLLLAALITAFQLWRHKVQPDLETLVAFRAGSGVTVGLVTFVATFFATVTDAVAAAMAVVVGIGFIVFGLTGIAGTFVRRRSGSILPLVSLVINIVLALAGLVLLFAGVVGSDAVVSIFKLLGILLIGAGLALGGYAYLLRQQEVSGVRG